MKTLRVSCEPKDEIERLVLEHTSVCGYGFQELCEAIRKLVKKEVALYKPFYDAYYK